MTAELTAETLRQLKEQGLPDRAIGQRYGMSESSVRNLRRRHSISGMTKSQAGRRAASRKNEGTGLLDRFGTEEKLQAELNRLQAEGHTSGRALAQAIGASVTTVRYWQKKFAGEERATRHLSPATAAPPMPVVLECEACDIYEKTTLPQPAAQAARSAWKHIHPGKGLPCRVEPDGGAMRQAYERKWC